MVETPGKDEVKPSNPVPGVHEVIPILDQYATNHLFAC